MSFGGPPKPLVERMGAFIADHQAVVDLRRYFGIDLPPGAVVARFF